MLILLWGIEANEKADTLAKLGYFGGIFPEDWPATSRFVCRKTMTTDEEVTNMARIPSILHTPDLQLETA